MKNTLLYAESLQGTKYSHEYNDWTLTVADSDYINQCWVKLSQYADEVRILEKYLKINGVISINERELLPEHMDVNKAIRYAIVKFDEIKQGLPLLKGGK